LAACAGLGGGGELVSSLRGGRVGVRREGSRRGCGRVLWSPL